MTTLLSPSAKQQFFDNAGNLAVGHKLYTYAANSVTPQATYTDRAGTVANTNPIILDARGEAILYLTPGVVYDYVLKTAADAAVWTRSGIEASAGDADAVSFEQAGAGAVTRTLATKLREVEYSITDFGADPTGVASCDAAWVAAQAAAALTGRRVKIPAGRFRFTDTITIGNRAPSSPSTLNGVSLIGDGWGRSAQTMNASDAATVLVYDGPSDGRPFIYIDGPISGVRLEGFMLDCNGKNVVPLRTMRSFHQSVKQVLVVNWTTGFGLEIGADTALTGYGGAAPISQYYEQLDFQSPGAGASGVDIASGTGNVNQVLFNRCFFDRDNTTSTIGLRLGYCDHINFVGCHLAQTGAPGSTGIAIQVRPQPGFGGFPTNITFTGTAMAGGVAHDSTLQAWNNTVFPALIFQPFYSADGAPVPPKSANGGADLPAGMARGCTDTGIEFGWWGEDQEQITAAATIAPKKRVVLLSGNATVTTITPPRSIGGVVPIGGYRITLIPQITGGNAISLGTVGNIAHAANLENLRAIELVYSEGTGFWSVVSNGVPTASGVYTPTLTGITNYSTGTAREFKFSRVGNTVHFAGRVEVTPTATGQTVVEFTLPITPASMPNTWDCAGTAVNAEATYLPGLVIAQATSARVQFQATTTASRGVIIQGSYKMA